MSSELEKAIEDMQNNSWAGYTEIAIDHAQHPRNVGNIPNADGFGSATAQCGDTMGIWLKVDHERIKSITFWTDGCGTTIASGSMATEIAKGKSIIEAFRIKQKTILDALGGLPEDSTHCALLAEDTLHNALNDYLTYKREPWKRAYRRMD